MVVVDWTRREELMRIDGRTRSCGFDKGKKAVTTSSRKETAHENSQERLNRHLTTAIAGTTNHAPPTGWRMPRPRVLSHQQAASTEHDKGLMMNDASRRNLKHGISRSKAQLLAAIGGHGSLLLDTIFSQGYGKDRTYRYSWRRYQLKI